MREKRGRKMTKKGQSIFREVHENVRGILGGGGQSYVGPFLVELISSWLMVIKNSNCNVEPLEANSPKSDKVI